MTNIDNFNFLNKRVLIRVDFNVPLKPKSTSNAESFCVADNSRIIAALPTIKKVLSDGGSAVLISHLGRPQNGPENKYSLKHIVDELSMLLNTRVKFSSDPIGARVIETVKSLNRSEVLLLENIRFYKEESNGDENFAKQLSLLGDVYVNDAFGTAHRSHASTSIVAKYFSNENRLFGYLMSKEIENADKVLSNIKRPFTTLMGGAKISDKILLIEQMLKKVDNLLIGGGMAYTFYRAQNIEIGNSIVEESKVDLAKKLLEMAETNGVNIMLPVDSVIANHFSNDADSKITNGQAIPSGWLGLDIGPITCELYTNIIKKSQTILWNGPLGVFEFDKFRNGTKVISEAIANATQNGAYSLIGGGDSGRAIKKFGFTNKVSYVSTGGGALLEYIEGKELPGIAVIRNDRGRL